VPAAPCLDFAELFADERLAASECFSNLAHPTLGALRVAGPFVHFAATPIVLERAAPLLGADTRALLGAAGFDDARIAALVSAGVARDG
jgi:formyl-CoA transferase